MTLWGADGFGTGDQQGYAGSTVGMDFRVELSQVPLPAAWLFTPALLGMFSLRRKSKTATA